jgi:hypothetical protein
MMGTDPELVEVETFDQAYDDASESDLHTMTGKVERSIQS